MELAPASEFEGEWEFEKCKPGAGPHGHTAITRREYSGQKRMLFFYWKCVDCGQEGRQRLLIRVDKHGCVL
jgi:hypothetical protein